MSKKLMLGHIWRIERWNPYNESLQPRVLAEMFVPCEPGEGAVCPQAIEVFDRPRGYVVTCASVELMAERSSPEKLAKTRRKILERRINAHYPIFAREFIQEGLAAKPAYYEGQTDQALLDYIQQYRERVECLANRPHELVLYSK